MKFTTYEEAKSMTIAQRMEKEVKELYYCRVLHCFLTGITLIKRKLG